MTKPVGPNAGGCWYCGHQDDQLDAFTCEFDAYLHLSCLMKIISHNAEDPEAEIICGELGVPGVWQEWPWHKEEPVTDS